MLIEQDGKNLVLLKAKHCVEAYLSNYWLTGWIIGENFNSNIALDNFSLVRKCKLILMLT